MIFVGRMVADVRKWPTVVLILTWDYKLLNASKQVLPASTVEPDIWPLCLSTNESQACFCFILIDRCSDCILTSGTYNSGIHILNKVEKSINWTIPESFLQIWTNFGKTLLTKARKISVYLFIWLQISIAIFYFKRLYYM